jgi:RES domain-containing protein
LCALEVLANASRLPADLSVIEIIIPRTIAVHALTISELPEGWNDPIPSVATRDLGTNWVKLGATAILSVPSSIVPRERNYLLNPNHPDFAKIRFGAPEPFQFDSRLK